jgi:hypothetical protein
LNKSPTCVAPLCFLTLSSVLQKISIKLFCAKNGLLAYALRQSRTYKLNVVLIIYHDWNTVLKSSINFAHQPLLFITPILVIQQLSFQKFVFLTKSYPWGKGVACIVFSIAT